MKDANETDDRPTGALEHPLSSPSPPEDAVSEPMRTEETLRAKWKNWLSCKHSSSISLSRRICPRCSRPSSSEPPGC